MVGIVMYADVLSTAIPPSSTPAPLAVLGVIDDRPKLQVVGVAAGWVIAAVPHDQGMSNRSPRQLIHDAVRQALIGALHFRQAIAAGISPALPLPAVADDGEMRQECIFVHDWEAIEQTAIVGAHHAPPGDVVIVAVVLSW